jgi:hypothetical protein
MCSRGLLCLPVLSALLLAHWNRAEASEDRGVCLYDWHTSLLRLNMERMEAQTEMNLRLAYAALAELEQAMDVRSSAECGCRCESCGACISVHHSCGYYQHRGCYPHCFYIDQCMAGNLWRKPITTNSDPTLFSNSLSNVIPKYGFYENDY